MDIISTYGETQLERAHNIHVHVAKVFCLQKLIINIGGYFFNYVNTRLPYKWYRFFDLSFYR